MLGVAWILDAADGVTSVVAGSVWNPDAALDETEAVLLFGSIRDLGPGCIGGRALGRHLRRKRINGGPTWI